MSNSFGRVARKVDSFFKNAGVERLECGVLLRFFKNSERDLILRIIKDESCRMSP